MGKMQKKKTTTPCLIKDDKRQSNKSTVSV